jgi:hypothetical protein
MRYTLVLWVIVAVTTAAAEQSKGAKIVELRGDRIPDHWVWRGMFHHLANAKTNGLTYVLDDLAPLAPDEIEIVLREAMQQPTRDATCFKALDEKVAAMVAARDPDVEIDATQQAMKVECRQRTLDARDRVLKELSEEAQVALRQWIDARRATMTVTVAEDQVERFMLPR